MFQIQSYTDSITFPHCFKGRGCYRSLRHYYGNYTEPGCMDWRELYEIMETPLYFFYDESWDDVGNKCR